MLKNQVKIISSNTRKTRVQVIINGETKHLHKDGRGWTYSSLMTSAKRSQMDSEDHIHLLPLPVVLAKKVNGALNND